MDELPDHIRAEIHGYLDNIKEIPGYETATLTLIIRSPTIPGGDIVISDDDLEQVAGTLMRTGSLS